MLYLRNNKKYIFWLLVFFSFAGFLSATYLTIEYYLGKAPECSLFEGCDVVAKSKYSQVGPIPLALLGVGYFLSLLFLFLAFLDAKKEIFLKLAFVLSCVGVLVATVLIWLQFAVIGAFCVYCLVSDISSIIIFLLLLTQIKYKFKNTT